ncbi:hypothetical protein [Methanogenium organophilum]|uniref:Uncharacterized protein n=1 Tax=Methanogenium organophilum TaxID=2199 RepID=A0A9X9T8L2_METOG|nr:hypothetical protein [Methanogenium organophilum]WAI01810.1 hypothetical protein OU421_02750 [Methanogenium organophilum]
MEKLQKRETYYQGLWNKRIDFFTAFHTAKDNTSIRTQGASNPAATDADTIPAPCSFDFADICETEQ